MILKLRTRKILLFIILLFLASFVRLYKINDLTEFLGDQGRDAIDVMQFERDKQIPPYGPPLSSGQTTGPFYYYLITPAFIFSHFNPVVPAIEMSVIEILSVVLFFILTTSLFGFGIGWGVSFLYALSPPLVYQDRILWPPTTIPFFTVIVLLSMYVMSKKHAHWGLMGLVVANMILTQFHYANGITAFISGVFIAIMFVRSIRDNYVLRFVFWLLGGVALTFLISFPFLAYEAKRGFSDVLGSVGTFATGKGGMLSKRGYLDNIILLITYLSKYLLPVSIKIVPFITIPVVTILALLKKNRTAMFLAGWFVFGILLLAFYKDNFQPQYAFQFIPVLFLLIGYGLYNLQPFISRKWVYLGIVIIAFIMIVKSDVWGKGDQDIYRTKILTDTMIRLSHNQPFSFTLITSRSFSDLHYRFFFALRRVIPAQIDSPDYGRLFLVCESGQCPTVDEIHMNERVYTVCYERQCKFDYPIIDIWKWKNIGVERVGSWAVYVYER